MLKAVFRWTLIVGTLLGIGPVASAAAGGLHDHSGGHAVTLLLCDAPMSGILAGAITLLAASVTGLLGTWFFSLGTGMACAGFAFAWGAWRLGTIDGVLKEIGSSGAMGRLAVEGAVILLLGTALAALLEETARRHRANASSVNSGSGPMGFLVRGGGEQGKSGVALTSFIASLIAGGAVVWIIGVTTLKGQTVAAALLGGLAAGAAGQIIASSKGASITTIIPMLALTVLAAAGPFAAQAMHGSSLSAALYAGQLMPLARPISLDWAAGAFLGVPIGLAWAGSMLDKRSLDHA